MPRRRGPSLSREDVIRAAIACLERDGPDALGVARVARELGIKPPSLYNHVRGGDDLQRAVAIEGWRRFGEMMEALPPAAPEAALHALADGYRRFARDNAALYQLMARTSLHPDEPDFATVARRNLRVLQHLLAHLGLRGEAAIHGIRTLRAALHGFVLLETGGQLRMDTAPDETFRWMTSRLVRALRPAD